MSKIRIPLPSLQIDFSFALGQIRKLYLQEALSKTVAELSISVLDKELSLFVPQKSLQELVLCQP
jgi:hypothetical protein